MSEATNFANSFANLFANLFATIAALLPAALDDLHFLRPFWLGLLPVALSFHWVLGRRHSAEKIWRNVIAPHLLAHLTLNRTPSWRVEPRLSMALALVLAGIALAGPTWEREPPPFVEDRAPLVIALDLGQSMNSVDVQPSRLTRAKQKIRDLLALRQGARTALIVYGATAHTVLPFTDDDKLSTSYLAVLETNILPQEGKRTDLALVLADAMLAKESVAGSVVLLTDSVENAAVQRVQAADGLRPDDYALTPRRLIWGIGRDDGVAAQTKNAFNPAKLADFSAGINATFIPLTLENVDVVSVQRQIDTHLEQAQAATNTVRWRDAGYWLLWPLVLLAGLSFRRGWTVRW